MSTCKYCHKEFKKKSYQQVFCCPRCKQQYWDRKRPDRHSNPNYYREYNRDYDDENWVDSFYDDPYYDSDSGVVDR